MTNIIQNDPAQKKSVSATVNHEYNIGHIVQLCIFESLQFDGVIGRL